MQGFSHLLQSRQGGLDSGPAPASALRSVPLYVTLSFWKCHEHHLETEECGPPSQEPVARAPSDLSCAVQSGREAVGAPEWQSHLVALRVPLSLCPRHH